MISRIWRAAGLAWADLMQPTGAGTTPYTAAASALGHAVLGATAAALLGMGYGLPGALAIAVAYWLAKERGDLRRRGAVLDGLEDALTPAEVTVLMDYAAGYLGRRGVAYLGD